MKFSCEKALLQNAVSTASRAVSTKSSIPALEGVLLSAEEELTICGYNMQIGIRTTLQAEITETGSLVLNARLFGDIIRRMPDDVIVFSSDNKMMVHLSCGNAEFDIMALSASDYPEMPEIDDEHSVVLNQNVLKEMIGQTSFAVSTNESRPIHTGSLFEVNGNELTVVSVDGFRLALRREKLEQMSTSFSFVAPGSALNEVEKICESKEEPVHIILGNRHIQFEVEQTQLICRRLEGEFLNYKVAIPRNNPISLVAECRSLLESIERVSVVISEKVKSPVRCVFGLNQVALSAKTGNGEASDICLLEGDGQELEIGFNNRYLMEALRYAPAERVKIEMNTGISPCVIVPEEGEENFLYMVLPVRLKNGN